MAVSWLDELLTSLTGLGQLSYVTKIPRITLWNFQQGRYAPSTSYLNTLRKQYERVQYWRIRIAGGSTSEARKYRGNSPSSVTDVIGKLNKISKGIAEYYNRPDMQGSIQQAMSESRRNWTDKPPQYVIEYLAEEE